MSGGLDPSWAWGELNLSDRPEGALLSVKAQPGAKRDAILGVRQGALRVSVTAAPEKGKANAAIMALLAETLDVSKSQIELIAGDASRDKRFLIGGLDSQGVRNRLTPGD